MKPCPLWLPRALQAVTPPPKDPCAQGRTSRMVLDSNLLKELLELSRPPWGACLFKRAFWVIYMISAL